MAAPKYHIERLREQLLREIGTVIARELRDPRVPEIVTVTDVKLARDARNATVYASVMGDADEKADAINALNKAAPFIQRTVAQRVVTKHFPHLIFKLDNSIEYGQHINELFKEIADDLKNFDDDGRDNNNDNDRDDDDDNNGNDSDNSNDNNNNDTNDRDNNRANKNVNAD